MAGKRRKVTYVKVEVTDEIGSTKEFIGIVKGDSAKILCKDRAGDWNFTIPEIDQYIDNLQTVRGLLADAQKVELPLVS